MSTASLLGVLLAVFTLPSAAAAQQTDTPSAAIQGEAVYPRPSREIWDHVKAVLEKSGFRADRQDNKNQIVVTQWRRYDAALFPALPLAPSDTARRLQLHIMVGTSHEPARVMVGSIVEVERRVVNKTDTMLSYRVTDVEEWFFDALDTRVGVKHEPMATSFGARTEQGTRLSGATPCVAAGGDVAKPVRLSDVRPVFPAQGFGSGEGKVALRGMITEHGSLTELSIPNPNPRYSHYEASARAAVSLWRFKPPSLGGCPISTLFSITVSYTIR